MAVTEKKLKVGVCDNPECERAIVADKETGEVEGYHLEVEHIDGEGNSEDFGVFAHRLACIRKAIASIQGVGDDH